MILFAQAASYGLADVAIAVVIVAALAAIVFIAIKAMGVTIPNWVIQILCVVGVAVVAILAIKFVARL